MSDNRFPLDAEQIVRGLGWITALFFDRTRRPGDDALGSSTITIALADAMGVRVPVQDRGTPYRKLLPYGSQELEVTPKSSSRQPQPGGTDVP